MPGGLWIIAMVVGYAIAAALALTDHLEPAIILFCVASLFGVPPMRRRR